MFDIQIRVENLIHTERFKQNKWSKFIWIFRSWMNKNGFSDKIVIYLISKHFNKIKN